MDNFSPWTLLGDFTAWVLIIGLTALVIGAAVLMVLTAMQLHHDRKTDKEFLKSLKHPENKSRREHPSNQDRTEESED